MAHLIKERTINYKGNTFIKGMNTLDLVSAFWVSKEAHKLYLSTYLDRVVEQRKISTTEIIDLISSEAEKNPQVKFRFMLNVSGDKFNAIFYKEGI